MFLKKFKKEIEKNKKQKGFTLVEIIIAVGLFATVATLAMLSLLAIIDANNRAKGAKILVNNLNAALEQMSRELRTGYRYTCSSSSGVTPTLPADCLEGRSNLSYIDKNGDSVYYRLDSTDGKKTIQRKINTGNWIKLTSDDVSIENLKFYVRHTGLNDGKQPRVLITVKGTKIFGPAKQVSFDLQTGISQRLLQN